jgi:small ligand-binding sensory domain FIST
MSARIATGLARPDAGVASFAEAASRAALQLGGAPADLAVVFAGAANLGHAEEGLAAVQGRLHARALLGCGAQGVVGDGRELEEGGVVVWAASLPGAEIETFHLETVPTSETAVAVAGMPELDGADAAIVLVDPYTFPIDAVLAQLADERPGLPVVGGLASAGGRGWPCSCTTTRWRGGAPSGSRSRAWTYGCASRRARDRSDRRWRSRWPRGT